MDKKTFNTVLASVMAGAMTLGVASFAKDTVKKKSNSSTSKTVKTDAKGNTSTKADSKEHHETTTEGNAADHQCGEGKCGDEKK